MQAIGELELIRNEQMHALLDQLVVTNLEHQNTPAGSLEDDSCLSGIDVIPSHYPIFRIILNKYFEQEKS